MMKFTDDETGKSFTLDAASLVSDTRDVFMSRRRAATYLTPWNKMSEDDQQQEIVAITNLAEEVIRGVVGLVADKGFGTVCATLENVSLKDSKATLKIANLEDPAVLLAVGGHIGKAVRIVVADAEDFDQTRHAMEADLDQPDLPMGDDAAAEEFQDKDELQEEVEAASDEAETPPAGAELSPAAEGHRDALAGVTSHDDNPFEDGTPEAEQWTTGFNGGRSDMLNVENRGASDFEEGKTRNPFKAATPEGKLWRKGFDAAKVKASEAAAAELEKESGETGGDFDDAVDQVDPDQE